MSAKPTIVMVPGAWHKPVIYSGVEAELSKHGYPTVSLPLHSAGAIPADESFDNDVATIRKRPVELVDEGKEVVLVVHSYSGLPGGEAPKELGQKERASKGLNGGVIRYVVINGFATPAGFQPAPKGEYSQFPPWMKLDLENQVFTVAPEDAKNIFYNNLPSRADELQRTPSPECRGLL